jgi:hypothetical protein
MAAMRELALGFSSIFLSQKQKSPNQKLKS